MKSNMLIILLTILVICGIGVVEAFLFFNGDVVTIDTSSTNTTNTTTNDTNITNTNNYSPGNNSSNQTVVDPPRNQEPEPEPEPEDIDEQPQNRNGS